MVNVSEWAVAAGLGGAGDAAGPLLCRTLAAAREASDWRTQINAAHALNEAVRSPSPAVQAVLEETLGVAMGAMERCVRDEDGAAVADLLTDAAANSSCKRQRSYI